MTSFFQGILAIFGLGEEKKRIDSEWGQAINRMHQCTKEIRETRSSIILDTTRNKLLSGQRMMKLRMNHLTSSMSMEPIDGIGKTDNT